MFASGGPVSFENDTKMLYRNNQEIPSVKTHQNGTKLGRTAETPRSEQVKDLIGKSSKSNIWEFPNVSFKPCNG